jgi:hypothetical protein
MGDVLQTESECDCEDQRLLELDMEELVMDSRIQMTKSPNFGEYEMG